MLVNKPCLVANAGLILLFTSGNACGLPDLKLSDRQWEDIRKGKVAVQLCPTKRSTMKDVVTIGYIAAPADEVWDAITDYDNYSKMFPSILKSELRNRNGGVEQHYSLLDYPWPLPDKWTLNEIVHAPNKREISWHRIEGTVKELDGFWHLYPEGEKTLVVYSARFDPGIPFIPAWVIELGSNHIAPQTIQSIRKHIKKRS